MNVAVTGGTGFIGRALVQRLLADGHAVRLLTRNHEFDAERSGLEIRRCDLLTVTVQDLGKMLDGCKVLYHCAGQLSNPVLMHALHVDGLKKIMAVASGRVDHWVQLSSVGVYGSVAEGDVLETSPLNPQGPYETTKAAADLELISYAERAGFSYTVLRPSNVYGSMMKNRSLYGMMTMIDKGLFFFVGPTGASANYIHVDNVVEALILCATDERAKGRVYNLSDTCTMEHFVNLLASGIGRRIPRLRIPKTIARSVAITLGSISGFPLTESRVDALSLQSRYPIDRIVAELGYRHVVSIEDGLRDLANAYRAGRR